MKTPSLQDTPIQAPAVQLARLSGSHGYRFEGDIVHLNAMFALMDPAAHGLSWALQLWACPCAPASALDLAGHVVAEVPLPPMAELADEIEHFDVSAAAWPPAGGGEHAMVLVLASGRAGQFNQVHDLAVYPRREQFIQPRMRGNVGYRIEGGRVHISVERVENPRPAENLSGTLSLELWALPAPYAGGRFEGHPLAGARIGSVGGQRELALQPLDVAFAAPPAGAWELVLMLREWTAGGFVTRDSATFATPFISAPAVEPAPALPAGKPEDRPAAAVSCVCVEPAPAPVVEKSSTPAVGAAVAPAVASAPAPASASAAVPAPAAAPAQEFAKPAAVVSAAKAPADASAKRVSVNSARVEELAAVNGLSKKLAHGIVGKRPFNSLDDLCRVKGLGAKLLAKIRSSLKL
jgi:DNA uptake protein ComE-like DNA-binding protein